VVEEHSTFREYINELEDTIKALQKSSEDNVIKALTKHELALQKFFASSIGRLASMI
jgi:hemerythrin-like domain-containing protein